MTPAELDVWRQRLDDATAEGDRKGRERDAAHAAFHGRAKVNSGRVEARAGYRGRTVCLDCYYGREWK